MNVHLFGATIANMGNIDPFPNFSHAAIEV